MSEIMHQWDRGHDAGYMQAWRLVFFDREMSDGPKMTYFLLCSYARRTKSAWPGQDRLALERGVSRRQIRTHIKALKDRGLLRVEQKKTARGVRNVYHLLRLDTVYSEDEINFAANPKGMKEMEEVWGVRNSTSSPLRNSTSSPLRKQTSDEVDEDEVDAEEGLRLTSPSSTFIPQEVEEDLEEEGREESELDTTSIQLSELDGGGEGGDSGEGLTARPEGHAATPWVPDEGEKAAQAARSAPEAWETLVGALGTNGVTTRAKSLVHRVWAEEMHRYDASFMAGDPLGKENGVGESLLKRYDPREHGELLLRVIRVAIWDWPAIQKKFAWFAKGKDRPALPEILYLAEHLAGASNTGITALPSHRVSAYKQRWIDPPLKLDEVGRRAKELGMTRAQYVRAKRQGEVD